MGRYVFVSSARLDLKEINNYLAEKNPQAARKLQAKIREKCRQLADFPGMGRISNSYNQSPTNFNFCL